MRKHTNQGASAQEMQDNHEIDTRKAPRGARVKVKVDNPGLLIRRVMGIVFKKYGIAFILVLVMILVQAGATLYGTLFQKSLIDNYILPMVQSGSRDFGPLAAALLRLAMIYVPLRCSGLP